MYYQLLPDGPVPAWEDLGIVGRTVKMVVFTDIRGALEDDPQYAEQMALIFDDLQYMLFHHEQLCCEAVDIEDVVGDINDLIGVPLTLAEEVTADTDGDTWTFYRFQTAKGDVSVRWNGYDNCCSSTVEHYIDTLKPYLRVFNRDAMKTIFEQLEGEDNQFTQLLQREEEAKEKRRNELKERIELLIERGKDKIRTFPMDQSGTQYVFNHNEASRLLHVMGVATTPIQAAKWVIELWRAETSPGDLIRITNHKVDILTYETFAAWLVRMGIRVS